MKQINLKNKHFTIAFEKDKYTLHKYRPSDWFRH